MRKLCLALIVLATISTAQAKTEFGKLDGAEFRIDVPDNWNGTLVIFYHGYRAEAGGVRYGAEKPLDPFLPGFIRAGCAVIQSGYSQGGWALEQAIPETEALRRYFLDKYERPKETYIAGVSMGGLLTIMTIEQSPESYAGGLDLCGAAANSPAVFTRGFDLRVLFDYYFPGVLPDPAKVPADYEVSNTLGKTIAALLQSKPEAASVLRRFASVHDHKDLVSDLLFATWALRDIERRAGGNPFDNRNTIYTGTSNDNMLNDGIKRYAADRGALAYLQRYYTPTGRLMRPVLAIHTTYDPLVPASVPGNYALLARVAGAGDFFVVQYVKREGHCSITPQEVDRAFAELRQWKNDGAKPIAGALK